MNQSQADDFHIQLNIRSTRLTGLITYSQVDLSKFLTRQSFGQQVVAYFNEGAGKVNNIRYLMAKHAGLNTKEK